ncbi:MAG: prephenate dehydratase [Ectothiorhodospiraceae bacterium]|nr:prephenate dehydratase [Chromatiales bacterium]MCP5154559.1 prephenate dehydratase [Ectothiorhodospiraceae bacterium]
MPDQQTRERIAFQGVPGAYSQLACVQAYPALEPLPCESFEAAFKAVESGDASLGMIPIENSLGGRVADIHHLLPESSLYIVAEHFQPVNHYLLGAPGASLDTIRTVTSHPQGLAQCRGIIRELKLQPVVGSDTAGSAREVAERGDPTVAAIASQLAGEIYGLQVLRARVEDRIGNTTRFVVMSRRREEPDWRDGPCMTSIIFQVRSVPGALYKALGGFATNGVNITKLESYITDASFRVAQFYAELEGHPAERHVAQAFEELQFFCTTLRVLGTFPQHAFRQRHH